MATIQKLELNKETIMVLTESSPVVAAEGDTTDSCFITLPPFCCPETPDTICDCSFETCQCYSCPDTLCC